MGARPPDDPYPVADEAAALAERIGRFVDRAARRHSFDTTQRDALALEVIRLQARALPPLRRLFEAHGADPNELTDWRQAPAVPTAAFRSVDLAVAPPRVVFRSSGTTAGARRRSIHRQPFPQLYHRIVAASFPAPCLPRPRATTTPMLSLVPRPSLVRDSSLAFMVDFVMARYAAPESSVWALEASGLDVRAALAWLECRAQETRPALVLATALALDELLRVLRSKGIRFALADGSVVFETGGFKGRERQASRAELVAGCADLLGVPEARVVREYGMTELTSQAYTRVLDGGDPERFECPPWLVPQVVAPSSLEPLPRGETGLLRFLDLGNVGSAALVLTEDLGCLDADACFRLLGRAAGADLRGCSLAAEELIANP